MQTYEIITEAHSAIRETWRVKARDAAHARMMFQQGEAEFVSDQVTGEAAGRTVAGIEPTAEPLPTLTKAAPQPVSLAAVRFVRDVAAMQFEGHQWEEQTHELQQRARRIAERLA